MNNNKSTEFSSEEQELAMIAKVLSHPARIAIIKLLAEKKEILTGNIHESLPISRPTVSRHLKELKNAGIIKGTIDGLKIHYCLDMNRLSDLQKKYDLFFRNAITSYVCDCD